MNATSLPGFTAAASLSDGHLYRATPEAGNRHGRVMPAGYFDEIDLQPDAPLMEQYGLGTTHGGCLKRVCIRTREYYPGLPVCDQWIWIWGSCWR